MKKSFYIHPEFAIPDKKACPEVQKTDPAQEQWTWTGKESLHPIWALTKLTPDEIARRNMSGTGPRVRFNMAIDSREVNIVVCGRVITVRAPVAANTCELEAGEELVMEVQARPKKVPVPTDWTKSAQKRAKTKPPQHDHPKSGFDKTGRQDI